MRYWQTVVPIVPIPLMRDKVERRANSPFGHQSAVCSLQRKQSFPFAAKWTYQCFFGVHNLKLFKYCDLTMFRSLCPKDGKKYVLSHLHFSLGWKTWAIDKTGLTYFLKITLFPIVFPMFLLRIRENTQYETNIPFGKIWMKGQKLKKNPKCKLGC